jgi:hypothetical protein
MRQNRKYFIHLILAVTILVSCLFLFDACKREEAPMTPTKLVREIFGRPEKVEDSGVISVEYNDPDYVIHYNFYPPGKATYEEELGEELTTKIKKLFASDKSIGNVEFTVFGLSTDAYGNTGWKPVLYFDLDKATVESEDWKILDKKELLGAVKNLKWFRKETNEN